MNEMEFLKKRANEFYERAFEDIEKKRYNLAVLDFEQALQLYLKYIIGLKTGDYPKIHYLSELIEIVTELYKLDKLKQFLKNNRLAIKEIEDAYITSRYFPREFTMEETEDIKNITSKIMEILEDETGEKLV